VIIVVLPEIDGTGKKQQNLNKRAKDKLKKEHQAVDEGGPTREFFSQVWAQLSDLSIKLPGGSSLKLFEKKQGGLLPLTDDYLEHRLAKLGPEREDYMDQIRCYFRAIGRMLAHCLLLSPNDFGPVSVPSHSLPLLYQSGECKDFFLWNIQPSTNMMLLLSVLLRGFSPKDKEYLTGSLIDHICDLFDIDKSDHSKAYELLLKKLLPEELKDAPPEERNHHFRDKITELYIENRKIFIDNFNDGLTLGGNIDWAVCFQLLPPEAVSKIAFAEQLIREEDLVDQDGNLRFIKFAREESREAEIAMECYKETQEQLKKAISLLFQQKARDEPAFLTRFVAYCTGQSYIPAIELNPDFEILIEFNYTEMGECYYPVAYTAVNKLLLPAEAYGANIETFQESLLFVSSCQKRWT
jgi:hypothetical protein